MICSEPYPGLRPYEKTESSIFFGRESLCDELLDKLSDTRFLSIIGPSGCGKSSLLYAGILADLRIGFMPGSKDYWKVAEMRPGDRPFKNLADALKKKSAFGPNNIIAPKSLRSGLSGFIDTVKEAGFPENTNLLLIIDQFEEIFRYHAGGGSSDSDAIESSRDEADDFVSLLLALSDQELLPIYVIITMRTDFLGDCAKFSGLPEAVNSGLFLVPRLTKLQLQRAIVEPARVFGYEVEDKLISQLLNDIGTEPDDLPLMQHVLMKIYNSSKNKRLTYQQYLNVGGFKSALSEHASEAYNQLSEEKKFIAEKLFRCLSEREKDSGRDTRRPTKLIEIADVCIKKPEEDKEKKKAQLEKMMEQLTEVVDVFREPKYNFITPKISEVKEITPDTFIDISHESLIRQWKPYMEDWINAETKSISDYFQLEKNAKRWKKSGKKDEWLQRMPHLQISMEWKKNENPTPAWAERYKYSEGEEKDFNLAMEFLEASEEKLWSEQAEQEAKQKRELIRTRRMLAVAVLFILICILGTFLGLHLYKWDYATYYNTFVKIRGVPKGIGELNPQEVKKRSVSFKLVKKGRLGDNLNDLIRMEAVNSIGKQTPFNTYRTYFDTNLENNAFGECKWVYERDKNGNILYEKAYNKLDKLIWILIYSPKTENQTRTRDAMYLRTTPISNVNKQIVSKENQSDTMIKEDIKDVPQEKICFVFSKAKIVNITYTVDRDKSMSGLEKCIRYFDINRKRIKGPDDAYGQKIKYNKKGQMIELTSIDENDKPMNDAAGNATFKIEKFDGFGNTRKAVMLDKDKNPVEILDGWYKYVAEYNDAGNVIYQAYFDINNKLTSNNQGYAEIEYKYDNRGNITCAKYFGIDSMPTRSKDGYARWEAEYDGHLITRVEYLDIEKKLVRCSKGYAGWKRDYDDKGNIIQESYFDTDKKAMLIKDGYAVVNMVYNDQGNITSVDYFGTDGKPIKCKDGYAGWNAKYNDNGQIIFRSYYDINKKAIINKNGYAKVRFKYEDQEKIEIIQYFDTNSQPILCKDGYAGWKAEYDDQGNIIRAEYFDTSKKMVLCKDGYAGWITKYDERGNITYESYFDANKKRVLCNDGYAVAKLKYEYGKHDYSMVIRKEYLDIFGRPVRCKKGYAGLTKRYDKYGNVIYISYFDTNRKRILNKDNYAVVKIKYNTQGDIVREEYFGKNEEPLLCKDGYAGFQKDYDGRGNLRSKIYLDTNGNKMLLKYGYAEEIYYYDNKGNAIMAQYFDTNSKPAKCKNGYAGWKSKYDNYGNEIQKDYLDENGKLVTCNSGYAGWKRKYDEHRNTIYESYFDTNEKAILNKNGYAAVKINYNDQGDIIRVEYFGTDKKQLIINNKCECAGWTRKYNSRGNIIYESTFNANREKLLEREFDDSGNIIKESFF